MSDAPPPPPAVPSSQPVTPAGYGQPVPPVGYGQPVQPGTNVLAIISLVISILGFNVIAIILGAIGLSQIKRTGEKGRGLALAGIWIGCDLDRARHHHRHRLHRRPRQRGNHHPDILSAADRARRAAPIERRSAHDRSEHPRRTGGTERSAPAVPPAAPEGNPPAAQPAPPPACASRRHRPGVSARSAGSRAPSRRLRRPRTASRPRLRPARLRPAGSRLRPACGSRTPSRTAPRRLRRSRPF